MIRSKDEVPLLRAFHRFKILFNINAEPYSVDSYTIEPKKQIKNTRQEATTLNEPLAFGNSFYKLKVNNDGTISISLEEKNLNFENIHFIEIEDDLGDEYNFVSNHNSKSLLSTDCKWTIRTLEENKFRTRFSMFTYDLPDVDVEVFITCYQNSKRIDFETKLKNRTKNKRIRLHFPTNLLTHYISVDTPFGVLQRARPPVTWTNYATSQPLYNWIDHNDGNYGLAFSGNGLADYELYENGNGFAVTLIRAVGKLSSVESHSLINTPAAQCNRKINFSYSLIPHSGNSYDANIPQEQLKYQTKILTNQSHQKLELPQLFRILPENILVSSFKIAEDKPNMYVLRLFNPENKDIKNCRLQLELKLKNVYVLNLNEEKIDSVKNLKNQITFDIKPYEIITFGLEI